MRARRSRAEQREQTRADLVDAAERRFVGHGFHATSVDQVAAEAGYTKGAIYSNFASKEDLFFAVYERRAAKAVAEAERAIAEDGPSAGIARLSEASIRRRNRDDGWLAAFFEFWAHVIRHPEHRERFAAIHARAQAPLVDAVRRYAEEHGGPADEAQRVAVAAMATQLGLALERLTRPDVVDVALATDVSALMLEQLHGGGNDGTGGAPRAADDVRRRRAQRA